MSAETFIAFIGAWVATPSEAEIEALEANRHPLVKLARTVKLETYWGNFSASGGEEYALLVGRRLGVFGAEAEARASFDVTTLAQQADAVSRQLREIGVDHPANLILAWEPDW